MKHNRTLASVIACGVLAVALVVSPAIALADETSEELQERVNEAYATLSSYSAELELANYELLTVTEELAQTQEQIEQTETEIAEKEQEVAEGQAALSEHLSWNYKSGNTVSLVTAILNSESFSDLISNIFYANRIAEYEADLIEQVKTAREELQQKYDELAEQEETQQQLVADQQAYVDEINERVTEQQAYYESLDAELQEALAEEAAILAAQEALEQQQAEEAAAAAAAAAEAEAQAEAESSSSSSDSSSSSSSSSSSGSSSSSSSGSGSSSGSSSSSSGSSSSASSSSSSASSSSSSASSNTNTNSGNSMSSVAEIALAQVGKSYVWAAAGPNSFDCSGLVVYCYAQAGVSLTHSSQALYNRVSSLGNLVYNVSSLKAGDLVFWGTGGSTSSIYHVGIYIGNGQYVHAANAAAGVRIDTLSASGDYVGGGSPV